MYDEALVPPFTHEACLLQRALRRIVLDVTDGLDAEEGRGLPHEIRTVRLCALDCELPLELDRADVPECRVAA